MYCVKDTSMVSFFHTDTKIYSPHAMTMSLFQLCVHVKYIFYETADV